MDDGYSSLSQCRRHRSRWQETMDLLECRLVPLVLDQVTLFSVVVVTMARSSNGDGMDEASVYRNIEAVPSSIARPGRVIWYDFTTRLRCC